MKKKSPISSAKPRRGAKDKDVTVVAAKVKAGPEAQLREGGSRGGAKKNVDGRGALVKDTSEAPAGLLRLAMGRSGLEPRHAPDVARGGAARGRLVPGVFASPAPAAATPSPTPPVAAEAWLDSSVDAAAVEGGLACTG